MISLKNLYLRQHTKGSASLTSTRYSVSKTFSKVFGSLDSHKGHWKQVTLTPTRYSVSETFSEAFAHSDSHEGHCKQALDPHSLFGQRDFLWAIHALEFPQGSLHTSHLDPTRYSVNETFSEALAPSDFHKDHCTQEFLTIIKLHTIHQIQFFLM